ncbi:MAG TPA: ABC transporter permease, partial [Myxococcota bacterium]|nr:ABC transporter permease [Myxococcota bacterium]
MILLSVAIRNLLQSPRRSFLLSLAIGMVTAMLTLLLAISAGIQDNLLRSATTVSSGHVNVAGFYKVTSTDVAPLVTDVSKVRAIVEKNTPGLAQVLDRGRGWCKVTSGTATVQAGLAGVDINEEKRILDVLQLAPESAYKEGGSEERKGDLKRLSEPNSVVVFAGQAKRL